MERTVFRWLTGAGIAAALLSAAPDAFRTWGRTEAASQVVREGPGETTTVVLVVQPQGTADGNLGVCATARVQE